MRQETNNTFDKGLNKDLNPIVTPNNVLTDALNATFITFNGDELTLQNDAGNTKIPVPWDKRMLIEYKEGSSYNTGAIVEIDDIMYESRMDNNKHKPLKKDGELNALYWNIFEPSVKLSKGFYPIGIKEYGGVLYIVSGKKGERDNKGNYTDPLDVDMVEFGSYPSPIHGKHMLYKPEKSVHIENDTDNNALYKPHVLNDVFFRSGGYAMLNFLSGEGINTEHLWTPQNLSGIYKVKIKHRLNNGEFELTGDLWNKYNEYRVEQSKKDIDTPTHWIEVNKESAQEPFIYHCPSQFKGKLILEVVLNEPEHFKFVTLPTVDIKDSLYKVSFNLDWKNSGESPIKINGFVVKLLPSDSSEIIEIIELSNTTSLDLEMDEEIVSYEVIPETDFEWEDFPEEFKNKYTFKGTLLLQEQFSTLYWGLEKLECAKKGFYKVAKLLVLRNNGGDVGLNMANVKQNEKAAVFLYEDYQLSKEELAKYSILGYYTLDEQTGKPVVTSKTDNFLTVEQLTNGEIIALQIENNLTMTNITIEDATCGSVNVKIKFSCTLWVGIEGPTKYENISFKAYGTKDPLKYKSVDGRTFDVLVDENQDLGIDLNINGIDYKYAINRNLYSSEVINIGVINYFIHNSPLSEYVPSIVAYRLFPLSKANDNLLESVAKDLAFEVNSGTTPRPLFMNSFYRGRKDPDVVSGKHISGLFMTFSMPTFKVYGQFINGTPTGVDKYVNIDNEDYIQYGSENSGYIILEKRTTLLYGKKPS